MESSTSGVLHVLFACVLMLLSSAVLYWRNLVDAYRLIGLVWPCITDCMVYLVTELGLMAFRM